MDRKLVTYIAINKANACHAQFAAEDARRNYSLPGVRSKIIRNTVALRAALEVYNENRVKIMKAHGAKEENGGFSATAENCPTFAQLVIDIENLGKEDSGVTWLTFNWAEIEKVDISAGICTDWAELGILNM